MYKNESGYHSSQPHRANHPFKLTTQVQENRITGKAQNLETKSE